ncbi:MAG: efflux RND transporter permease subunit, partial [Bacteroidota bacterium]
MNKWTFQVRMLILLGSFIGILLIPYLSVQFNPSPSSFTLSVHFSFKGVAPPVLIESEITTHFERAFAKLEHLERLTAVSRAAGASLELSFNDYVEMDKKKLEILTLIRRLYPLFKEEITFPEIHYESKFRDNQKILSYTLVSELSPKELEKQAAQQIIQPLSLIKGIQKIELSGVPKFKWQIKLKENMAKKLAITDESITAIIKENFRKKDIGYTYDHKNRLVYTQWGNNSSEHVKKQLENLIITLAENRTVYLKDIATISNEEQEKISYIRINGKPGINLQIFSNNQINQLQLAK